MHLTLPVNYNYGEHKNGWSKEELRKKFNEQGEVYNKKILEDCFDSFEEVFLSDERYSNLNVISLRDSLVLEEHKDSFVIRFYKRIVNGITLYFIETGQYAGFINFKGLIIYISLSEKYNSIVLNHLLSYVNNINIDNYPIPTIFNKNISELDYLLCFLFIQKLEKASVLGLPKYYTNKRERQPIIKGKIDFNNHIKKDIPFKGKICVNYRERKEVQEIVDVIYYTLYLIKEKFSSQALFKIRPIYNEVLSYYSKVKPQSYTIGKAKKHSVLTNPMFNQFKKVIEIGEIIIKNLSPNHNQFDKNEINGNLYNTSELFELYIERILVINLKNWKIEAQKEISIYKSQFYSRKLIPDFVLYNQNNDIYAVLDAKFKTMNYMYYDLDREDVFQLHTYSYYFHEKNVFSGLVYPLQFNNIKDNFVSNMLDKYPNQFGVLGIELNSSSTLETIKFSERKFIDQLNQLLNKTD